PARGPVRHPRPRLPRRGRLHRHHVRRHLRSHRHLPIPVRRDRRPPPGVPMTDTAAPAPSPAAPEVRPGAVAAEPYIWPYDGVVDPARTALVNIDWQTDFCGPGGYVDHMGYDLDLTRAGLEPTAAVLAAARAAGVFVIHTREGHKPDLSDCPPNK